MSQNYLKNLPAFIEFETSTGRLLLCHGFGWNDMTRFVPEEGLIHQWIERDRYQWIVNGHTHQRIFKRFGEFFLVNPGTLRRDLNPGFVIIDFAKGPLRFLDLVPGSPLIEQASIPLALQKKPSRQRWMNRWSLGSRRRTGA